MPAADSGAPPLPTATKGRPIVTLRGVEKQFSNGTLAVEDFNAVVGAHEFVSLLGPSGCGKSTVLRMIAGLGAPTSGEIDWPSADHDVAGEPRRDLSFVFQEPTLMPWATAIRNVMLPLRLARTARSEMQDRAAEALALVGLGGFENAYPRELSGGMKMRVSIARAIVTRPRILLMDEPFAALDEITRFKLNNDLLELWGAQSWTVIFVTHSVFESVYLSQRIVVMAARPGRVISEIAITAPYPRDESFRTSPIYNDHCRAVSAELHRAMAA
ncbi:MAG: ABC transporter ATP-binding protein [Alphaproteobacteria bacterium]|nr:ABC transporter ATP-binding protein [Alphaproteobacteria bacterium]